jgi:hypothetical protein
MRTMTILMHHLDGLQWQGRNKWNRIGRVLRSEGMKPGAMGYFYKAIVQAVLLYGLET